VQHTGGQAGQPVQRAAVVEVGADRHRAGGPHGAGGIGATHDAEHPHPARDGVREAQPHIAASEHDDARSAEAPRQ
jgi:hypothetical protein